MKYEDYSCYPNPAKWKGTDVNSELHSLRDIPNACSPQTDAPFAVECIRIVVST